MEEEEERNNPLLAQKRTSKPIDSSHFLPTSVSPQPSGILLPNPVFTPVPSLSDSLVHKLAPSVDLSRQEQVKAMGTAAKGPC
jgi:hypothetical protein